MDCGLCPLCWWYPRKEDPPPPPSVPLEWQGNFGDLSRLNRGGSLQLIQAIGTEESHSSKGQQAFQDHGMQRT